MVAVVERLCAPLRLVGVRPARIGLVIAMALRFIPLVAERADRIREAQAARGGSPRGSGPATMVVPLLVQVLQLAHTVSEALDARGADDVPPPAPRSLAAGVTGAGAGDLAGAGGGGADARAVGGGRGAWPASGWPATATRWAAAPGRPTRTWRSS